MTRAVTLLALLLPSCAVGPRYRAPELPLPAGWAETRARSAPADEASLARWWTEFKDPLLERLVASALQGNLDLKIAAARIREARAARGIAASAGLPAVGVAAAYSRASRSEAVPPFKSAPGAGSPFGPREQDVFQAGFDASWEIDVFGGVKRDKVAALAEVQAAQEGERELLVTLLGDVARSYIDLRGAQQQLHILAKTVRSQSDTLELARARQQAGLGTELDVARAEGFLRAIEGERPVLERRTRQAVYRLGVLIGQEPAALAAELEVPGSIPPVPPEVPESLPSELLSRRPDLRRAERELAAATARIGVARADLFPRFSILGGFGRLSEDAHDLGSGASEFWRVIPGLRWPIFSGGRIRANVRVQEARQEQALHAYQRTLLGALEEVENALVAHARERIRQESLRAAVAANRVALELATQRYTGGLESFLSVLDAQRSVYVAEDRLVQGDRDVATHLVAVYMSLGGGWWVEPPAPRS
jgi:NodT family efflux transporter outer membrane factor (OMF) lipoprotein